MPGVSDRAANVDQPKLVHMQAMPPWIISPRLPWSGAVHFGTLASSAGITSGAWKSFLASSYGNGSGTCMRVRTKEAGGSLNMGVDEIPRHLGAVNGELGGMAKHTASRMPV